MTKYNKTDLTLTTLQAAHRQAIAAWSKAGFEGEPTLKWHDELARLEKLIREKTYADRQNQEEADKALADVDLIKEFADEQNEAMRTTDMKQPAADPLDAEDMWFKDGVVFARTHSCGCCSEIMSSDPEDYDYHEHMTDLDRMAAWVEQQEAKVQALRTDFNDYCNSQENG